MLDVPVVVITPSRLLNYKSHVEFGKGIRTAVEKSGKWVALIASCDWSHTHDAKGSYRYHPKAQPLDHQIVRWIETNDLEALATIPNLDIEKAKPDGIGQTLILVGAIPKEERQVTVLSYEAPTYFRLICAAYK